MNKACEKVAQRSIFLDSIKERDVANELNLLQIGETNYLSGQMENVIRNEWTKVLVLWRNVRVLEISDTAVNNVLFKIFFWDSSRLEKLSDRCFPGYLIDKVTKWTSDLGDSGSSFYTKVCGILFLRPCTITRRGVGNKPADQTLFSVIGVLFIYLRRLIYYLSSLVSDSLVLLFNAAW